MLNSILKIVAGLFVATGGSYVLSRSLNRALLNSLSAGPALKTVGFLALSGLGTAGVAAGMTYSSWEVAKLLTGRPSYIRRPYMRDVIIDADIVG